MGPLHGLMKEHSRALVMVIGDCMQDQEGGMGTACIAVHGKLAWRLCALDSIVSRWPSRV